MKLINIGFGNMVNASRLVAIVSPESAPIKRIIHGNDEKERGKDGMHRRGRCHKAERAEHVRNSSDEKQHTACALYYRHAVCLGVHFALVRLLTDKARNQNLHTDEHMEQHARRKPPRHKRREPTYRTAREHPSRDGNGVDKKQKRG